MNGSRALPLLVVFLMVGCGEPDPVAPTDAGELVTDAGELPDDAGEPPTDGGTENPDAGETTTDAGEQPDAGEEPDAGELPDAGMQTDAGEPFDAGMETDAGTQTDAGMPTDGGMPTLPNVIDNWGFESWPGALPDFWFGSTSNISSTQVEKVTTGAFEGLNAARLINTSGTHRRFTTEAKSMPAGKYSCTYQVRGNGEIRNAFFSNDYSSYSAYTTVSTQSWMQLTYNFNLAEEVFDTFELIFSVRNTSGDHLMLDDVRCTRTPEPCDAVTCATWERCVNATATCQPLSGRCNAATDCSEWQTCDATNTCVLASGRCERHLDCAGTPATPVCDLSTHLCIAGNPCAGVTCSHPATSCNPQSGVCELSAGACFTTWDCTGALPACDPATKQCVSASHPSNIIRNGDFEAWSTRTIPYYGSNYVPDFWWGEDNGITDPGSEILPSRLAPWTQSVHGGTTALQIVAPIQVAERFTTEKMNVPAGTYSCSYRVRGYGTIRHRSYSSGGWSTATPFLTVDSNQWEPVFFRFNGNVQGWRLLLYPSRTDAVRDHLQLDDVVCTRD